MLSQAHEEKESWKAFSLVAKGNKDCVKEDTSCTRKEWSQGKLVMPNHKLPPSHKNGKV